MSDNEHPPHPSTLRELAELQLVIFAMEQVIKDKKDEDFSRAFEESEAA